MPGKIEGTATINFLTTRGRPPAPGMRTRDITRPGVDGVEERSEGTRARAGRVRVTMAASSWSDAHAACDGLRDLQGEIVTYTDAGGEAHPQCALKEVDIRTIRPAAKLVGASGSYVVHADLVLRDTRSST